MGRQSRPIMLCTLLGLQTFASGHNLHRPSTETLLKVRFEQLSDVVVNGWFSFAKRFERLPKHIVDYDDAGCFPLLYPSRMSSTSLSVNPKPNPSSDGPMMSALRSAW